MGFCRLNLTPYRSGFCAVNPHFPAAPRDGVDKRQQPSHPRDVLSLESVVSQSGSVLILDPSCARVQVGLVVAGREPAWIATSAEAGIGLFQASAALLAAAGLKPQAVGAYILCDGPGSQLGIRTAAMAIRTWQALRPASVPIFSYRSLRLAAHGLVSSGTAPPFAVVCDARRESWYVTHVDADGVISPVERLPTEAVAALGCPLHQPDGFRTWAGPPAPVVPCDYTCGALFARISGTPVLEPMADAEPWNPSPPAYKTWSGERHRAPRPPADAR